MIEKNIQWYQVSSFARYEIRISRYCISFVSLLQSSRQFIHNRLNKPQRKPFIKVRERASERASDCGRVTYVRNFQQKPTGFTVGAVHRPSYLDLEIGTITRECARRKQKKKQKKAESGEREREREKRGKTRMHFCLHLPVTSEGTSCLGLLSPGGHYYCFKLACSFLRLRFSLQPHWAHLPATSSNMHAQVGFHARVQRMPRSLLIY